MSLEVMVHPSWKDHPKLRSEVDLSKNNGLVSRGKVVSPFELSVGTNKKLDWKCSFCDHEWKAQGNSRLSGRGCPACANQVVHIDGRNSVARLYPEISKEYQGDATKVLAGTNKRLDWKCSTCAHEWKAVGQSRFLNGHGCPFCAGQSVHSDGRNSMASTHPELAREYQGDPNTVTAGTSKKLRWKCGTCEHEWLAQAHKRSRRGDGCPVCSNRSIHPDGRNSLAITHPNLAMEYLGDPNTITAGSNKRVGWKCSICENEWKTRIKNRASGSDCPFCAGQSVHSDGRNSMANTHPELAREYQGDANKITAGSNRRLDWKCSTCEHEWRQTGSARMNGVGCPACSNYAVHIDGRNSLAKTHPDLAKEYQGDASVIVSGTHQKLDWKCGKCDYEWKAMGYSRADGTGCPACANRVIHTDGRNSMASTHPELAMEYQGDPNTVTAGTAKKLRWKCAVCDQEWSTSGAHRVGGGGCPACANIGYNPSKIGYFYIHLYSDDLDQWLKCGITNQPEKRIIALRKSADLFQIEVSEIELYKFDDGSIPRSIEGDLLAMRDMKHDPGYKIDGRNEFYKYEALDRIREFIRMW